MIFKCLFQVIIFTLIATCSNGQIAGKVINKAGEAIPFVNVVLYHAADTSIVSGTSADENGIFILTVNSEDNFLVGLSSVGYKSFLSETVIINPQNRVVNLGNLVLAEDTNSLEEVVVTAKKEFIQNTPTGKVINIQGSLITKGSSALQILERLPGVIIDHRNNSLSLNGQSGVTIMINGRSVRLSINELMAMLNGMNGDNIEKIELITSPTAQYDAEGGAGLINIVLKRNENEGTNINLSSTLGYGYREKASTSVSLTHGHKNLNYYASYSFLHDNGKSSWHAIGTQDMPALGGFSTTDFYSGMFSVKNTHNLALGFDFKSNPKTLVGGNVNYMNANTNPSVLNDALYDFESGNYIHMKLNSTGDNIWQNVQSSVFVEKQISLKSKLNVDVSYLFFHNNSPAQINSTYSDKTGNEIQPSETVFTEGNRGESVSKINIGVIKSDYSTQLNEKINLEIGLKSSYSVNTNNSKVERKENGEWVLDTRSQRAIIGNEGMAAAYSSVNFLINPKTTLTAGLRYEYWERTFKTNNVQNKYSQFFPSVHYSRKLSENSRIAFNLLRRISRPAYNDLVSNLFYNDPVSVFTGNPLLKPSITNAIKTEIKYKSINIGLTLQNEQNPIIRYQLSTNQAKEIYILSPQNLAYLNSYSINFNVPVQLFSWWKATVGGTSAYRKYKLTHTPVTAEKAYFFHNYFLNQTIKFPTNLELEITSWYNTSFYDGANKVDGFGVVNFGIAKKLNKDKGTIQFTISDVFKSMNIYTKIGAVTPVVFDNQSRVHYRDESAFSRIFKLSYSRSFGSKINTRNRKNSADEEKERVRQ